MILVDTGPLVALCSTRDALHAVAWREMRTIKKERFCTCEPVIAEASVHLPAPPPRLRLREIVEEWPIAVIPTAADDAFRSAVFDWLARYAEHEPDWADACIAVACGADERLRVWTYDREFRTTWRKPDGKAIPLAFRR